MRHLTVSPVTMATDVPCPLLLHMFFFNGIVYYAKELLEVRKIEILKYAWEIFVIQDPRCTIMSLMLWRSAISSMLTLV